MSRALEVLVELATEGGHGRRGAKNADSERGGQRIELAFGLRIEGDPADAALAGGNKKRADRRVREVVGDVQELCRGGGLPEAAVESVGNGGHEVSFLRSRRTPDEAAARAASAFEPSAAPMSS